MARQESSRLKNLLVGVGGGIAGLLAMRLYWQHVAPLVTAQFNDEPPETEVLDDIAVVGQQYQEDESATAALGRIAYEKVTGETPTAETKEMLSYLTHWGYGLLQGGTYGGLRAGKKGTDLLGGLTYGLALWLLGDETAVPMLGLQKGPTATSLAQHINRLGAHLTYGAATAVSTQLLNRIL